MTEGKELNIYYEGIPQHTELYAIYAKNCFDKGVLPQRIEAIGECKELETVHFFRTLKGALNCLSGNIDLNKCPAFFEKGVLYLEETQHEPIGRRLQM